MYSLLGYLGSLSGFFKTRLGSITLVIVILIVGAFVGLIGTWVKKGKKKKKK